MHTAETLNKFLRPLSECLFAAHKDTLAMAAALWAFILTRAEKMNELSEKVCVGWHLF